MPTDTGLISKLSKTSESLITGIRDLFASSSNFDDETFEQIEDHLIMSDIGVPTSQYITSLLKEKSAKESYQSAEQLLAGMRVIMLSIFNEIKDIRKPRMGSPHVILMVGVNGVGKTTTLSKIACRLKNEGQSVMLAACDTFRAAAIEQLEIWGARMNIPVIAQHHGADAAAVAYDAYSSAKSKGMNYLLIDSAGRQHTSGDLMSQLSKIKRVLHKAEPGVPHDIYMTVDAGNGQNMLSQVENFNSSIPLTGICVTKLDGTAKGGAVITLAEKFKIPVVYLGVGEQVSDLKPFNAEEFISALLPDLDSDLLDS